MGEMDVFNIFQGSYSAEDGECQSKGKSEAESKWVFQVEQRFKPDWKHRPLVSKNVSIYRIPTSIMQVKPEAYKPQIVALGPYYHKINPQFSMIDEHKMEAVRRTLETLNGKTAEELVALISNLDGQIRGCYDETIKYNRETLAWMFTVDGCFCVELFKPVERNSPNEHFSLIFDTAGYDSAIRWTIKFDIFKLENQIPLSVLITILQLQLKSNTYCISKMVELMLLDISQIPFNFSDQHSKIVERVVKRHIIQNEGGREVVRVRACHVLDLYRKIVDRWLTDSNPISQGDGSKDVRGWLRQSPALLWIRNSRLCSLFCRSTTTVKNDLYLLLPGPAVELEKVGIAFEAGSKGEVRFERRWFGRAKLILPKMYIDEDTEPVVRNLMAFEESRWNGGLGEKPVFCHFMVFMDYLIDSERDIALLREHEIIKSGMGRNKELALIFNKLCLGFPETCGQYKSIVEQIRQHYTNPVNKWINYFREQYCSSPCLVVSLFAATLLLCMTGVQTTYTILQYYS